MKHRLFLFFFGIIIIIAAFGQAPKKRKVVAVSGVWTWTVTDTIKSLAGGRYQTVATWTWQGTSTDTPTIHKNGKNLKFISAATATKMVDNNIQPIVDSK